MDKRKRNIKSRNLRVEYNDPELASSHVLYRLRIVLQDDRTLYYETKKDLSNIELINYEIEEEVFYGEYKWEKIQHFNMKNVGTNARNFHTHAVKKIYDAKTGDVYFDSTPKFKNVFNQLKQEN